MLMATYGLGIPGAVQFTGYTNTLGTGPANADATTGRVYFNGVQQGDDRIAKMFRNGGMTKATTQIWLALTGAAVGGTATRSRSQVQWQQGSPGGLIPVEVVTLVNRATTANDLAAFQALLGRLVFPASYPADLSGNGGGGKQAISGAGAY
jgi:hypothetical protein